MDILQKILVVLHILSFGIVMGTAIAQLPAVKKGTAKVTNGMLHGSLGLLVTGLALVGVAEMVPDGAVNHLKIGVKLLVLVVLIIVILLNRKKQPAPAGAFGAIAGLAALNVALAVIW